MDNLLKEKLKALSEIPGVSGNEQRVCDYLAEDLKALAVSIEQEPFGNLVVSTRPDGQYRIGLYAHMDEIGLVVKRISRQGQLFFDLVGNMDERILLASEWTVVAKDGSLYRGVIGNKSRHLQSASDLNGHISANDLFLDIGASCGEEVQALGIDVGCQSVFATRAESMEFGLIKAKALDNRSGCFVLAESLKRVVGSLAKAKVFGFFTVQEEIGARGARVVGFGKKLDVCISLDTVPVQNPGTTKEGEVCLGKGPVIRKMDYHPSTKLGMFSHPLLVERMERTARENNIPYQVDVLTGTYLDSSTAHLTENGIPGISLCIPRRYSHTPVEICSYEDIENAVRLLSLFLLSLDEDPISFGKKYQ